MVRAAAAGVIDYSQADPEDSSWNIRHRLLLSEIRRQDRQSMFEAAHRHWLSYVAHGNLTQESFADSKKHAAEQLDDIYGALFPWTKQASESTVAAEKQGVPEATIDATTAALISAYRQRFEPGAEQ